jgi:hypothetical protein
MQASQCGSQMGPKFWEVACSEKGIGGGGEYCGNNDAQLGLICVLCHKASGGSAFPARYTSTSSPA